MNDPGSVPTTYNEWDEDQTVTEIVDAIQRPQQARLDKRGSDGYLPEFGTLPGFGDAAYDDCREPIPHCCSSCGKIIKIGKTCKRSTCGECAPSWIVDLVPLHVAKMDVAARKLSARLGGVSVKKHHLMFSPPDDWILRHDDPLKRTREVIYEILDIFNAQGLVAYHDYRGRNEDDMGAWKQRMFSGRAFEGDVRAELELSPHFHCPVVSPHVPGGQITARVNNQTDWIVKRITQESSNKSLDGMESVARALSYTLSHTPIDTSGRHNQAQFWSYGSLYRDEITEENIYDWKLDEADRATRSVVPTTLGIPAREIRCEKRVDVASTDSISLLSERQSTSDDLDANGDDLIDNSTNDLDDEGSSDTDDAAAGDEDEDEEDEITVKEKCKGSIIPIAEADSLLNDEDWVERCPRSDKVERAYRKWIESGEWTGLDPPAAA